MNLWQLFAAVLAISLPVVAVIRLVRSPQWQVVVLVAQVIAIPEVAFLAYALDPGGVPELDLVVVGAAVFYAGALALVIWSRYERRRLMQPVITYEMMNRQHLAAFLARSAVVLLMSALVFAFEPWFAVANIAANAAWTLAWLPARWRTVHVEVSEMIARPVNDIYEFVSDTANWPRYREDFVAADPPGRVASGMRVVTRLAVRPLGRPNPKLAKLVEVRSVVVSVVPDKGYTTALDRHPEETGTSELTPVEGGTRVISKVDGLITWPQAALGFAFHASGLLAVRSREMQATLSRLKQVLEAPHGASVRRTLG